MNILEKAVRLTLWIVSIWIILLIVKYDVFEKDTMAILVVIFMLIGIGNVIDDLISIYKLIVKKIEEIQ